ncbi:MAG: hydroxyethylthiazole kinase, partial [Actinobacteria bacterium]
NFVVMNETANITLAAGALPVMAHAKEEVEEMVTMARALVLNIGTLWPELIDNMILAGKKANELSIPIVLDPVGAGATKLRTQSAKDILEEVKIDIVRGNAAEISILAGLEAEIKGVESIAQSNEPEKIAKEFAAISNSVACVTGENDFVSDGNETIKISNGHLALSSITGTGCMATTIAACFAAIQKNTLQAAAGGLIYFGIAGEKAASVSDKPGTFHTALYDAVATIQADEISSRAKAEILTKNLA